MKLKINEELKSLIPPLRPDEYDTLETSILRDGIRDPLVIWSGIIVDGHNRYNIAQEYGLVFETLEKEFDSFDDAKVWMIDNQKGRRNLTDGWKFELAQVKRDLLKQKGKEKLSESGKKGALITNGQPLSLNDKPRNKHNTRTEISKELGWSSGKTAQAEQVWDNGDPEIKEAVKRGEKTIGGAYNEIKRQEKKKERKQHIESQKKEIENREYESTQDKKYQAIIIDPPWNYGRDYDPDGSRVANPYPEMPQSELKQLELPADDNCMLYLWTTHQFIWDAKELIDYWGFDYKATLVWNKQKIGMGYWVRMQCEFCLVAVKGKPIWENTTWRDIINESRREHSRKPEKFYEFVRENTVGNIYEFFSRTERKGIDSHGNDKNKFSDDLVG